MARKKTDNTKTTSDLAAKVLDYSSITSSKGYDFFLRKLYAGVKQKPELLKIPSIKIIAAYGNEPPTSEQFRGAIEALYGIGYTLKMGLKFNKLPRPKKYFDYRVGGLEAEWWSNTGKLEISNPKTLRWKAYLMVPHFVDQKLFAKAVSQAKAKKPEVGYHLVGLERAGDSDSVQVLHVGPYDKEEPTVEAMQSYMKENGLKVKGRHHEIYISDPRKTKPAKLKTVIRFQIQKV